MLNDFVNQGLEDGVNTFTYALDMPRPITEVRVITGNRGGDGRIFSTFVLEASTDGGLTFAGIGGPKETGY